MTRTPGCGLIFSAGVIEMSKRRLFKSRGSIALLALTLLALSACHWEPQYVVKRLPVGENRSIIILAETAAEISTAIYYQVKVGEEIVVSLCVICYAAKDVDSLNFKILSASGGNLIAAYEETDPERILLIHDFSSGESWPRGADWESNPQKKSRGVRLLERLQREHLNSNLKLNPGESCGMKWPVR